SLFGPLAELPLARLDALYRTDLRGPLAVAQSGGARDGAPGRRLDRERRLAGRRGADALDRRLLRDEGRAARALRGAAHGGGTVRDRRDRGAAGRGAIRGREQRAG